MEHCRLLSLQIIIIMYRRCPVTNIILSNKNIHEKLRRIVVITLL